MYGKGTAGHSISKASANACGVGIYFYFIHPSYIPAEHTTNSRLCLFFCSTKSRMAQKATVVCYLITPSMALRSNGHSQEKPAIQASWRLPQSDTHEEANALYGLSFSLLDSSPCRIQYTRSEYPGGFSRTKARILNIRSLLSLDP